MMRSPYISSLTDPLQANFGELRGPRCEHVGNSFAGLSVPVGIAFGPDGNFYATSVGFSAILAYDGETGAFLGPLVPSGLGGIGGPRTLAWKAKTTVCHVPPGRNSKSKSLTIGYLSARDHLRHGDTLGPCQ